MEYVVELAQAPHLFVIRKQQRKEAAAQPVVLAYYYVLDKMVYQVRAGCVDHGMGAATSGLRGYNSHPFISSASHSCITSATATMRCCQAPTLHAALSTRVRRCLWSLQEGFHRLKVRQAGR